MLKGKEELPLIRKMFHKFISRLTSFQTVAYFFAYRLKEALQNGRMDNNITKEIGTTSDKIESYYVQASDMLKGIEEKLTKIGISGVCKPFTESMKNEMSNIFNHINLIKNTSHKFISISIQVSLRINDIYI